MKNLKESNIKLVCFSELKEDPLDELQEQLKAITPNVSAEFREKPRGQVSTSDNIRE
jgi:hypothetical protein